VTLVRTGTVKFVDIFEIWFKSATAIIAFDEDLRAFLRAALIKLQNIYTGTKKKFRDVITFYAQFHSFIRVGDFPHKETGVIC
jgi:hypothetical protein